MVYRSFVHLLSIFAVRGFRVPKRARFSCSFAEHRPFRSRETFLLLLLPNENHRRSFSRFHDPPPPLPSGASRSTTHCRGRGLREALVVVVAASRPRRLNDGVSSSNPFRGLAAIEIETSRSDFELCVAHHHDFERAAFERALFCFFCGPFVRACVRRAAESFWNV